MICSQIYLTITLLIFEFGPIDYYVEYPLIFWGFIFIYQVSFLFGYVVSTISLKKNFNPKLELGSDLPDKYIWAFIALSLMASVLSIKQLSMLEIFNPFALYDALMAGLLNPGEQYTLKMESVGTSTGNKFLNIVLFFIAFSKIIVIPIIVATWHRISLTMKVLGLFATLLPVISSISNGTNKSVFDFVIYFGSSLLAYFAYNYYSYSKFKFGQQKFFIFVSLFGFVGALTFFGQTIGQRGGSVAYIENISPLGHIKLVDYYLNYQEYGMFWYIYTWLSNYLVQGYYGFSLSLNQEFTSTFGFGNSTFLMRQVYWLTGVDLQPRTFQNKIDPWWGESAQWHSFYAHFANDFHFVGVSLVCFLIGFYMSRVWASVINRASIFGFCLMPIFTILFVFVPANNQVFGLLDTFSAFTLISLFWYFFGRNKFFCK